MRKRLVIFLFISYWCNSISAQITDNYSDNLLTSGFKVLRSTKADFELAYHIQPFLKEIFIRELQDTTSFTNPYDSLSKYINIQRSSDKLLKIYCWSEKNTGCAWVSNTFAQFRTNSGEIKTVNFDTIGVDHYQNLYIFDLQQIEINNKPHYLVLGGGGQCGNHKYSIARVYKILNDAFVQCESIFENESEIDAGSNRFNHVKMKYSSDTKILSYYSYTFDNRGGFYSDEKALVKWKLSKKGFKLIN